MRYFKYFLIILIILLVIAGGYFLSYKCGPKPQNFILEIFYNLKCSNKTTTWNDLGVGVGGPPTPPSVLPNQTPTTSEVGGAPTLSFGYNLIYDGVVKNYFVDNSKIILVNNLGEIIKIQNNNQEVIGSIGESLYKNINFSPDGSKIVVDLENIITVFDVESKKWRQLENNSFGGVVSKNNELFYFVKKDLGIDLMRLDLNKNNASPQKIMNLNVLDYKIIPKDKDNIFLVPTPSSFTVGSVLEINLKNKNVSLVYELPSLDFRWDEDTNSGILFYTSDNITNKNGVFSVVDKNLKVQQLSFLTLPSKCVFKKEGELQNSSTSSEKNIWQGISLVCAIPRDGKNLQYHYVLNDYLTRDLYTEDDIYLIDLANNIIKLIWKDQNKNFDIDKIKILENKIFFINRFDGKFYSLNISL